MQLFCPPYFIYYIINAGYYVVQRYVVSVGCYQSCLGDIGVTMYVLLYCSAVRYSLFVFVIMSRHKLSVVVAWTLFIYLQIHFNVKNVSDGDTRSKRSQIKE